MIRPERPQYYRKKLFESRCNVAKTLDLKNELMRAKTKLSMDDTIKKNTDELSVANYTINSLVASAEVSTSLNVLSTALPFLLLLIEADSCLCLFYSELNDEPAADHIKTSHRKRTFDQLKYVVIFEIIGFILIGATSNEIKTTIVAPLREGDPRIHLKIIGQYHLFPFITCIVK